MDAFRFYGKAGISVGCLTSNKQVLIVGTLTKYKKRDGKIQELMDQELP